MTVSEKPLPPRSRNLTIIAVLLGVIGLLSLITLLTSGVRIGQPALPQGVQPGNMVPRGDFQPGEGNLPQGNFQQRGAPGGLFSLFGAARTLGFDLQYIRYVSMGITILGIVLTLVAAYFVWKQKRWALNLAMLLAVIFLIGSAPGLFLSGGRMVSWLRTSMNALSVLAALPVIFLGILPSVRDSVS